MTDPGFVAASYAIVLGGLALYVSSVVRRIRTARRTVQMLERERDRAARDRHGPAVALDGGPTTRP